MVRTLEILIFLGLEIAFVSEDVSAFEMEETLLATFSDFMASPPISTSTSIPRSSNVEDIRVQ